MGVEMRPAQALRLWHDVTMALVTDGDRDLTARQMAILMTVYLEPPPHTVRGLAARLNVTKPVVTRALDTLGAMRLLSRRRDDADRRNVVVTRTVAGALFLEEIADTIIAKAADLPR